MTAVLLSASIPSRGERGDAVRPYFPADIAAATSSAVEAVLRSGVDLVFGGHPTISPVVLQIAGLLGTGSQVHIWQSAWFEEDITPEVRRLVAEEHAHLHMVDRRADLPASIGLMRERMMLGSHEITAAFLVGGMEGIAAELDLLTHRPTPVPIFAFHTPGGMAARLREERDLPTDALRAAGAGVRGRALVGRAYGSLALSALAEVGLHVQRRHDEL